MQAVAAFVLKDLYDNRGFGDVMEAADRLCVAVGAGILEAIGIYGSQGPETISVENDHWIDRDVTDSLPVEDRRLLDLYMISLAMRIAERHTPEKSA